MNKKVIIENGKRTKFFPVTLVENIIGLNEKLENIDISNITNEEGQSISININNIENSIKNIEEIISNNSKAINSFTKELENKANKNHVHTEYANKSHTHSDYLKKDNIKIITNKTIYSSDWSSYSDIYRAKISDSNVTSSSIVDANIHRTYLEDASNVLPLTDSYSGYFYMYANSKPSSSIKIDYKIIKEG